MPEERPNSDKKGCDDKQTDNLEVGNRTTASNNTTQIFRNSSEITDQNLQHQTSESIEVDPNDVISVEELSHEPL